MEEEEGEEEEGDKHELYQCDDSNKTPLCVQLDLICISFQINALIVGLSLTVTDSYSTVIDSSY